ncbi:MAG: alpha/beta hydrolase [Bacillota bacterium]
MKLKRVITILAAVIILVFSAFYAYVLNQTYPAEKTYLSEIRAKENLAIKEENKVFVITPAEINPTHRAIIFYPGGLVAPEAYLYKMGHVAECLKAPLYVIKAPFNAAIFDVNAAARIMDNYNLDTAWVGGHSLGGISAARFTAENMDIVEGLFLFGSYSDQDLGNFEGKVISIMGDQDLIINRENYEEAKQNLPPRAKIIEVEELNHSDFGNYGLQSGDGQDSFSEEEVIELICKSFKEYF